MIEISRTDETNKLRKVELRDVNEGSWYNLINPTQEEIQKVSDALNLEESFLRNCLDADERSRIEIEDDHLLIIVNVPLMETEDVFDTLPLGLIYTPTSVITVCSKENRILQSFNKDTQKFFDTKNKLNFILNILFRTTKFYLRYLDYINKKTDKMEAELRKSMQNKALFQLLEIQKSLVYFTTALKDNYMVLQKIMRLTKSIAGIGILKFSEDDIDLLEDVIIENNQAIEMVEMHRNILENMMDAFAGVISNNVSTVMKFLTVITIILAVPTMIASFWGMNVPVPFLDHRFGFEFVVGISLALSIFVGFIFARKGMF